MKRKAFGAISMGLGCVVPLSWIAIQFSNRDPFLFGAVFLATALFGPLAVVALGIALKSSDSGPLQSVMLVLLFLNAGLFLTMAAWMTASVIGTGGFG